MTDRGPLDRLHPLTPVAAALVLVAAAYAGRPPWSAAIALAAALGGARWARVSSRVAALTAAVVLPTFVLLVLLNAVVVPAGITTRVLGVPVDRAAAVDALAISLRLGAAVAALGVVVIGVAPRRLTRALAQRGLPAWAAYLIIASLEAVPEARRRAGEVLDAQRCRGLRIGGAAMGRLRALVPLAGPLIVSLVTESEERALALDARGFDPRGRRTAMAPIEERAGERALRIVLWMALVVILGWRCWALIASWGHAG